MKILLTIALYCVLVGLIVTSSRADDIDIYRGASGPGFAPVRIMFALDLNLEGAGVLCADAAAAACKAALGDDLYAGLDLFGLSANDMGNTVLQRSADGRTDVGQQDPAGNAPSVAAGYWRGVTVDRYDVLRSALRTVLTTLGSELRGAAPERRVEVGLMALHADNCAGAGPAFIPNFDSNPVTGCSQGAYLLQGFTDISDPAELDQLLVALAALPDPGRRAPWMAADWRGHPYKLRDVYLELNRYLGGQAVFNGFLGTGDYGSRVSGNLYHTQQGVVTNDVLLSPPGGGMRQPLLSPDTDVLLPGSVNLESNRVADARYLSPVGPEELCTTVGMVHLLFGPTSPSSPDTDAAIATQRPAGGLELDLAAGEAGDRELVARMAAGIDFAGNAATEVSVPVQSYFLALDVKAIHQTLAAAGGTGQAYSIAEPADLVAALEAVFGDVSGDSSSLVAAALVGNEPARSSLGKDVFLAMFRPQPGPAWPGNVKKLKIAGLADDDLQRGAQRREIMAQAPLTSPPAPALSAEDGQILPDALTFWTDPLGADVQAFNSDRQEVSGRDGRSVARGGAGQQVPGFLAGTVAAGNSEPGARQVYTLTPDEPAQLLALDATAVVLDQISANLDPTGSMTEDEEMALIRWIRGQDTYDEDEDGDRGETRRWLLGDVLHSRPLAVSYGARPGTAYSAGNPDIRIFFGTNNGVLHMLQNTSADGAESGRETWAFLPPELLGMQTVLAQNNISALQPHPYGLDGEPVSLVVDNNGNGNIEPDEGDVAWVFIGQRRGGTGLYAFDMSDPDSPRYMWTIDNTTPGFEQLALTFSTPRVARLDLGDVTPTPVLIFGGGYHGGWAGPERVGKDAGRDRDLVGNAIYVVDPSSGNLIWRAVGPDGGAAPEPGDAVLFEAQLTDSIPSPLTIMDADRNGVDDRAYVGDSGGSVWRVDLTEHRLRKPGTAVSDASNWYLTRLAVFGGAGESDRRFFHAPDVVQSRDEEGAYDGVVVVSGNRAAPRDVQVRDFAYLLKDRKTAGVHNGFAMPLIAQQHLPDISAACSSGTAQECMAADLAYGWKLALLAPGEKGLSTPLVSNGKILFTSYVPLAEDTLENEFADTPDSCRASAGHSRIYGVNLRNGSPGLAVAQLLELPEEDKAQRFESLGAGMRGDIMPVGDNLLVSGPALEDGVLPALPGRTWWRAYWREEELQ